MNTYLLRRFLHSEKNPIIYQVTESAKFKLIKSYPDTSDSPQFTLLGNRYNESRTLRQFSVSNIKNFYKSTKYRLKLMFLPKDYPKSVTREYLPYSIYSFVQSVTGTITGTMGTQALLQALGASATFSLAMSATTNWIIKDGVGLLGGVLYASVVSNRFDSDPKKYRFLSNLLIQMSTFIELLSPLFPSLFLAMASLSNIGKNIGWLASSATRAAMHNGFTMRENLGDVTAKAGAQGTAAGLVGTGMGIGLSVLVGTAPLDLILAFAPLSIINIFSGYMASNSVVTRSLNLDRAEHAFYEFCLKISESPGSNLVDRLKSPEQVSLVESFILKHKSQFPRKIIIDCPLDFAVKEYGESRIYSCFTFEHLMNEKYKLMIDEKSNSIFIWFQDDTSSADILKESIKTAWNQII